MPFRGAIRRVKSDHDLQSDSLGWGRENRNTCAEGWVKRVMPDFLRPGAVSPMFRTFRKASAIPQQFPQRHCWDHWSSAPLTAGTPPAQSSRIRMAHPFGLQLKTAAPGIPYHSIMGNCGKGGNRDHTKPVDSDGLVPCWSRHLDGPISELEVPSGHRAHQNPQAIAEVPRILTQYAGK